VLRLICAVFCTTPTKALEREASILPIKHQVNLHKKQCTIHFNKLSNTSPIIQRLPQTWRNSEKPTAPSPLQPKLYNNSATDHARTTNLLELTKHTCHSHERIDPYLTAPWHRTKHSFTGHIQISTCKPETKDEKEKQEIIDSHKKQVQKLEEKEESLVIYSDRSMVRRKGFPQVSAAVVGYHKGIEVFSKKMGMGGRAKVYDAEMAGLMLGAKLASTFIKNHPEVTKIHYFIDNSAAAGAIFDPKPQLGQLYTAKFHQRMAQFLDDNTTRAIEINWCPSHCKIKGNDRADELAKEAMQMAWNTPIGTSRAFTLHRAKATTQTAWIRDWQRTPKKG